MDVRIWATFLLVALSCIEVKGCKNDVVCHAIKLIGKKYKDGEYRVDPPQQIVSLTLIKAYCKTCVKDTNYGYDAQLAYAKYGCKAKFQVCVCPPPSPTSTTPAAATTGKPDCRTVKLIGGKEGKDVIVVAPPYKIVSLTLTKQYYGECVKDYNYGYTDYKAYAHKGCKARFELCVVYYNYNGPTPTPPPYVPPTPPPTQPPPTYYKPECSAVKLLGGKDGKDEIIVAPPYKIVGLTLTKQYYGECVKDYNYGYTDYKAYAHKGCRGRFELCVIYYNYNGPTPPPYIPPTPQPTPQPTPPPPTPPPTPSPTPPPTEPPTTTPAAMTTTFSPGVRCEIVTLISSRHSFKIKKFVDVDGNPAEIVLVEVKKQLGTKRKCKPGHNFYYDDGKLVAVRGCAAKFKVCYKYKDPTATTAAALTTDFPGICIRVVVMSGKKGVTKKIVKYKGQFVDIKRATILYEVTSGKCTEDNYYFSGSALLVDGSCKAVFSVCFMKPVTTTLAALTTTLPPRSCRYVVLHGAKKRDIVKAYKNEEIESFKLIVEYSKNKCLKDPATYGYTPYKAYAMKGCEGRFELCSKPK